MIENTSGPTAWELTLENDRKNLAAIDRALDAGRINSDAADYMKILYSDGMSWFREVFHVLGKCFGAPKAAVMPYDYASDTAVDQPMLIADINPLSAYLVHHRLDADPMRNQFFTSGAGHKIDLSVSSIVTVIVGAQKKVSRALEKVAGKYYQDYVNDVAATAYRVIASDGRDASARAIEEKIRESFADKYITAASETVLGIIGRGHERVGVQLVRELDKIETPYQRLQDVWRVKCLFDLVPQARTFIERMREMMPDRIISVRDKFYDMENTRNYRDAKMIINIGHDGGPVVPMEIICQVRAFFEYEHQTHAKYEISRRSNNAKCARVEKEVADLHDGGIREYNLMICQCLEDLFDRVGWNLLYSRGIGIPLFDGFPHNCPLYYPQKILDIITDKLDNAIENEVFHLTTAPVKLTQAQESEIFHFMARFVLVAAMPYSQDDWTVPSDTMAGKLFNFVMKELRRYYKK